ncbi:MAG: helix-turn-helix domain-containing protein [Planctomycetes bacterium]|nr:helix-turn-helix domain-containing protein [Planctomycetota bacterium]
MDEEYKPTPGETIDQYLKRLRSAANQTLQDIAKLSSHLSGPQSFTAAWLSSVENGQYQQPGIDKLRTLASIYSRQLGIKIPEQWLLELAGYKSFQPIGEQPDEDDLRRYLRHNSVMTLVIAAGNLAEAGYMEEVQTLAKSALFLLRAYQPDKSVDQIYEDKVLSTYVQKFIAGAGL